MRTDERPTDRLCVQAPDRVDERGIVAILVIDRISVVVGDAEDHSVMLIEDALRIVHGRHALELLSGNRHPLVEALMCTATLFSREGSMFPRGLVTGEKDRLHVAEQQALSKGIEGNQGHPLTGHASALQEVDGLLQLLHEEQEAIPQISSPATDTRKVEAHVARIRPVVSALRPGAAIGPTSSRVEVEDEIVGLVHNCRGHHLRVWSRRRFPNSAALQHRTGLERGRQRTERSP